MAQEKAAKQSTSRVKPFLMIVAFVVSLFLLVGGLMAASNWYRIKPYKALANDLNTTLGGGYKISYTWNCSLETTNCPSARMIKDANFKDNDEARALFNTYINSMKSNGYETQGISICEPRAGFVVYCSAIAKKDGKIVTINAKQDFIGIDIQS